MRKKRMKKIYFSIIFLSAVLAGCSKSAGNEETVESEAQITETAALQESESEIEETENAEWLEDKPNLKALLSEIPIHYTDYETEIQDDTIFWDRLTDTLLTNSMFGFDYLNELASDDRTELTKEQIEYVAYSLTGQKKSYDEMNTDETIDISQAASFYTHGELGDYTITHTDKGEWEVEAQYDVWSEGVLFYEKNLLQATLVENDDSCFDGYSVKSMKLTVPDDTPWAEIYIKWLGNEAENELEGSLEDYRYKLIYADDDYIPELYLVDYEHTDSLLLTISDHKAECMLSHKNAEEDCYMGLLAESITKQEYESLWEQYKLDKKLEDIEHNYWIYDAEEESIDSILWLLDTYADRDEKTETTAENNELVEAYLKIIDETEKANEGMQGEMKYDLIYVTDDDIPELLVDCCSYWISLYTYVDNKVYPIMEYNPYGTWGRMYEYRYREGIIYSPCYSFEGDTQINYDELYKINDNYLLEALYTYSNSLSYKWNSENEVKYYFDANEISKEQYDQYLGSKYEILEGVYSAEEIKEHL